MNVYVNGLKQEYEPLTSQGPEITNIAETWGMTHGGRIYSPEPLKKSVSYPKFVLSVLTIIPPFNFGVIIFLFKIMN